jgi:gephyrin
MSKQTLKAAILIISTTAVEDPSTDRSGSILQDVFREEGGQWQWEVAETKIVGDVFEDIQQAIKDWTERGDVLNVIVTTGGTGFATTDQTPEVRETHRDYLIMADFDARLCRLCWIARHLGLCMACCRLRLL